MVSFVQSVVPGSRSLRTSSGLLATLFAVLAGGCSADVARFDFASANLNDTTTGTIPTPPEPVKGRSNLLGEANPSTFGGTPAAQSEGGTYYPPHARPAPSAVPAASAAVTSQPLNDATPPAASQKPAQMASLEPPKARTVEPAAVMADHAEVSRGEEIEVKEGDTLYSLARRNQVSINDLMSVNGLKGTSLKPGQKLYLPKTQVTQRATPHTLPIVSGVTNTASAMPAQAPAGWEGTHTVQQGESLYGLAVRYKTKAVDIQRYNGIQDVRKVKPGMVLHVPGAGSAAQAVATQQAIDSGANAAAPAASPAAPETAQAQAPAGTPSNILNSGSNPNSIERMAAANPAGSATDATPAPSATGAMPKLRWPVEGKIITAFGRRSDGTNNDGVNLAAPQGTDIHAAEAGTVAYSGGDLKGYGNLILLRHDNGWVTAYAHADELLVQRGDVVKRGQVIAKAGKSGQVDQPQVHFELRQGQKPVDPVPFMEKM